MITHPQLSNNTTTSCDFSHCQTLSISVCTCKWQVVTSSIQKETQHQVCTTCTQGCSGNRLKGDRSLQVNELTSIIRQWHHLNEFLKFKLNEYFTDVMIFSTRISFFKVNKSANEFMQHHVLFHESISLSHWMISDSL